MVIRLSVATMGVAGFAWLTSPLTSIAFLVVIGGLIVWHASVTQDVGDRPSLPPAE